MQKYEPIGLKTMDGKEIMTYTKEYYFTYVKERMEKAAEELIEDELITSKAMLIESSKGQEELYKNINDIIENQSKNKENNEEESKQLEDLIKYELIGTKNENMIKELIEKIKNEKGGKETMTNASKIINREMRKRESKGRAEGIAMMARKLKNKMSIEEIKELTGLSEEKIQSL